MKTILDIYTDHSLDGNKMVKTTRAQLFEDEGMIRTIHIVYIRVAGRTKTCHTDKRVLDRESGDYFPGYHLKDVTYKEAMVILKEWESLPAKDVYKQGRGLLKSETRYLKETE